MSQIEDRIETLLDDKKTVKLRSGRLFRVAVTLLVLGIVGFLSWFTFKPRTYTATAWIQIRSEKPHFIFDEPQRRPYEKLVETQFALIRSPLIIEKTLENPEVARLGFLQNVQDKTGWLVKKLKLHQRGNSELITISISTPEAKASEKIVNSVVDAYFDYNENEAQEWNVRLVAQLQLELNRQQSAAKILREEIRRALELESQKKGATGIDGETGQTLQRDIQANVTKLDELRAELKMLHETLKNKPEIPGALLLNDIEENQELQALEQGKKEHRSQIDAIVKFSDNKDDSTLLAIRDQLTNIDKMIAEKHAELEQKNRTKIERDLISQIGQQIFEKTMQVRAQEILIEHLKKRFREQVLDSSSRTLATVDISIRQEQLRRINSVLDLLQSRVVQLQTEMNAPPQVQLRKKATTPTMPD